MKHINGIVWKTKISANESNYLQATYYEMVGARNLAIQSVTSMPEAYAKLKEDYIEALAKHESVFEELRIKYVPDKYRTSRYRMNVAFDECELRIEEVNV